MAKRYTAKLKSRLRLKGLLLYVLPMPLLFAAVSALLHDRATIAILCAINFALAMSAAALARKGMLRESRIASGGGLMYEGNLPYKLIAALLLACVSGLTAYYVVQYSLFTSLISAFATPLGFYLYYGFDPVVRAKKKSTFGMSDAEFATILDEAKSKIADIEVARKAIHNIELKDRLRRIIQETQKILDTIEKDPHDIKRARKFLKVYLEGVQQVTQGYARTYASSPSPELADNFRRVLDTIETVIADQQRKLVANDVSDLDIQIKVLQMQLEKEGV